MSLKKSKFLIAFNAVNGISWAIVFISWGMQLQKNTMIYQLSCKYWFLCTYSNIFHVFDEAPPVVLSKVLNLVLESIQLEF